MQALQACRQHINKLLSGPDVNIAPCEGTVHSLTLLYLTWAKVRGGSCSVKCRTVERGCVSLSRVCEWWQGSVGGGSKPFDVALCAPVSLLRRLLWAESGMLGMLSLSFLSFFLLSFFLSFSLYFFHLIVTTFFLILSSFLFSFIFSLSFNFWFLSLSFFLSFYLYLYPCIVSH